MKKQIFAVTCDQFNLGTVFVIWSIHYLSGQTDYWHVRDNKKRQLPSNPIDGATAHGMSPNDFDSIAECRQVLDAASTYGSGFTHFKYTPRFASESEYHTHNKRFHTEMSGVKTINITCDNLQHLIGFLRSNYKDTNWQHDPVKVRRHCKHYWPDSSIDDTRLNIAFNIRPYHYWRDYSITKEKNILNCQFRDVVFEGESTIIKMMKFLDIPLDQGKLDHWRLMYKNWKGIVDHIIQFCDDIDLIVENTINSTDMDLTKYKMNVLKEGIILHMLLFKHNLNLKRPIDKFPSNTRDLRDMLIIDPDGKGDTELYN